jgi:MoxR-like ATPase
MTDVLRRPSEQQYAHELAALAAADTAPRPPGWRMSPRAVVTFLLGGSVGDTSITAKYVGNRRLVETAVATLATDRALLLLGVPGTAKSWVSEHLAAAICGDSQRLIQGTAGTDEAQIRYGWNYAQLLAKGPSRDALVETPLLTAMEQGALLRLEELTRLGADVQDTLITVLSEKVLPIPELHTEVRARRGFNVIATANNRDKGVNDMSSALRRRFNVVVLPLPASLEEEVAIVTRRVEELGRALELPPVRSADREIERVVRVLRELRGGQTLDGKMKLKVPGSPLSAADAIGVMVGAWALAAHLGDGEVGAEAVAAQLVGAVVKDPVQDAVVLQEYVETVVRERAGWSDLYASMREVL